MKRFAGTYPLGMLEARGKEESKFIQNVDCDKLVLAGSALE